MLRRVRPERVAAFASQRGVVFSCHRLFHCAVLATDDAADGTCADIYSDMFHRMFIYSQRYSFIFIPARFKVKKDDAVVYSHKIRL